MWIMSFTSFFLNFIVWLTTYYFKILFIDVALKILDFTHLVK